MRKMETQIGMPQRQPQSGRNQESSEATKVGMGLHAGNSLTEGEVRALERMKSRKKDETQIFTHEEMEALRKAAGIRQKNKPTHPENVEDSPEIARIRGELEKMRAGKPTRIVHRVDRDASFVEAAYSPSPDDTMVIDLEKLRREAAKKDKRAKSKKDEKPGLVSRFLSLFK